MRDMHDANMSGVRNEGNHIPLRCSFAYASHAFGCKLCMVAQESDLLWVVSQPFY